MNLIRAELADLLLTYQAVANMQPSSATYEGTSKIKALQEELQFAITNGSKDCCKCGNHPIGLRHVRLSSGFWSHIFEIGCCGVKAKIATPQEERGVDLEQYDEKTRVACVDKWNSLQLAKGA